MANEPIKSYRHILLTARGGLKLYAPGGYVPKIKISQNNRHTHSNKLLGQIKEIEAHEAGLLESRNQFQEFAKPGICITFEGVPGFDLLYEKLEFIKDGIILLSAKQRGEHMEATCYVPEGKLSIFVKRIQDYAQVTTRWNRPAYADLINSINNIKIAALKEFWTDSTPLPDELAPIWWEVWINTDYPNVTFPQLREAAAKLQIVVSDEYLSFPERMVVQIYATANVLSQSIEILNLISEVRIGNRKPTTRELPDSEKSNDLLGDLLQRLSIGENSNVGVAILDTGVNRLHPLLSPILNADDMHSSDALWTTNDHHGHGTTMAGLAAYGDLLNQPQSIGIPYRLESIKILPPIGVNEPHLYGKVTADGIYKCEEAAPDRKRVFSKSITSDLHKSGEPSSYSAKIDDLASGASDNKRRLFVISAGNTSSSAWHQSPTSNLENSVEEPAQAWNALTVGAITNLVDLPNTPDYIGWSVVASQGMLSPYSCTSENWHGSAWPFKPDVVWEGGNCAINPAFNNQADDHDSLSLLTTNWEPTNRLFTMSCMTSAATAQVSGVAGRIMSIYPNLWPETIRAILVHSASWTQALLHRFPANNKNNKETLLRTCGYGIPDENLAIKSLSNNVVLIVQDEFQPFHIVKNKGKTKQLQIHNLPWPRTVLQGLGGLEVRMKVTLSYFIEPNPAQRGWQSKFKYQSFGLRFDLRRKDETEKAFEKRVTKLASESDDISFSPNPDAGWLIGEQLRNRGSVHSDTWTGTAVALANRDKIAIYPVLGWWRERLSLGKCERRARYSLIISIESSNAEVNLYEQINIQLGIPLENLVEIDS